MINWIKYNIEPKNSGQKQQKVKCPECKRIGKQNWKDTCLSIDIETGLFNCHKCGFSGNATEREFKKEYERPDRKNFTKLSDKCMSYMASRGISQEVVMRNKLVSNTYDWIIFPYLKEGELINFKARNSAQKDFRQQTNGEHIIYKYDDVKGQKEIIFCEGEFDCLAFEMAGFKNTTSVDQGAPNENDKSIDKKLACITNCYSVFESAEIIYLATDNDPNGIRLQQELIRRFGVEKCRIVEFNDCKDANEVLLKHGKEKLIELIKNAKWVKMEGIFTTEDVKDKMIYSFLNGKNKGTTTYFKEFNNCWTWRTGELNIWTGYNNEGKSQFLNQLMLLKALHEGWNFGIFSPENFPIDEYFDDLAHCLIGKSTDKTYQNVMSLNEYNDAIDFLKEHFFVVCPEDNYQIDNLLTRFRFLVRSKGIRGIIIDPYNQVEHLMERGEREDLYISKFISKLKKFAVVEDVSVHLIAHQVTPIVEKGKDYPMPDAYKIKGGGTFSDKADNVITVWRQYKRSNPEDKSVLVISQKIKKQRLVGIPGETEFYYSRKKNQYFESYAECENDMIFNNNLVTPTKEAPKSFHEVDKDNDFFNNIEPNTQFDTETPF